MVKTELRCADCWGRIVAVRDLENPAGLAEIEAHHFPSCPAMGNAHEGAGDARQHEGDVQAVARAPVSPTRQHDAARPEATR